MWINRCRLLMQSCFNHVENIKTRYPTRALGLSIRPNNFVCQQTKQKGSSILCSQTRPPIRNVWSGLSSDPYSSLVCRFMSMKCTGDPPESDKSKHTKGSKKLAQENTKSSAPLVNDQGVLVISGRQVRQNFHQTCEDKINAQINEELFAAYTYISMASFCNQDNVALGGFAKFFTNSYKEEIEHMELLITYLNKRGGQLRLTCISNPQKHEWKQAEELVSDALHMEQDLNEKLLALHACASQHNDPHLTDFLEEHYLQEQVVAIKVLADLLTTLRRAKQDLSVHLVDQELMGDGFSPHGNGK